MGNFFDLCSFCQLLPRERKKQEYLDAVKNRYKHLPDVKRIVRFAFYASLCTIFWNQKSTFKKKRNLKKFTKILCDWFVITSWFLRFDFLRHRHLPKPIFKAAALRRTIIEAERRKEERRKAHSAPGTITSEPLRKRRIIKEVEWPRVHWCMCSSCWLL